MIRRAIMCGCLLAILFQPHGRANACGPSVLAPVFVFKESSDFPFNDFAAGNTGIIQPTFGRKTLLIAYRYLNGGTFTPDEQEALVRALRGKPPEDEGEDAVKLWVTARREVVPNEEKPPEIYTEREYGGYDFFPNCTRNAFEVATATLKDRVAKHGAEDRHVRAWLAAQDLVFQNCQTGAGIPNNPGPESPSWLRKDRDYQIGAALLYSLNFDEARSQFAKIASDPESPWQETADYLVGRTLVRHASLSKDETKKSELIEKGEQHLAIIAARRGKFAKPAEKLIGLIKYRAHPDERIRELATTLANDFGNANLQQDLIDYAWLFDKIEDRVMKAEEKRRKALTGETVEDEKQSWFSKEAKERYDAVQRGDLIEIGWSPKQPDGRPDHDKYIRRDFKPNVSSTEVRFAFEEQLGRPITPDELKDLDERHAVALKSRQERISPNRQFNRAGLTEHVGCDYDCERMTLDLAPQFLRADDLSDWLLTMQTSDPRAYNHALAKWRETKSTAWFVGAITKADSASPRVQSLLAHAAKIDRQAPAFTTAMYHRVRLELAAGKRAEARKILDEVVMPNSEGFPASTRNLFLEQRMHLSDNVSDFLKFAQRKPAAFYEEGVLGSLKDHVRVAKARWDLYHRFTRPEMNQEPRQTREGYEQEIDEFYRDILPWDDRYQIDDEAIEILNWHFSLEQLEGVARSAVLPNYLRRPLVLAVWTRAIVLRNDAIATRIAPEVLAVAPEIASVLKPYLEADTAKRREDAALFVLLKFSSLTPLVVGGIPEFTSAEQDQYYFQESWWCTPSQTEYSIKDSREVPKMVTKPPFLMRLQLEQARKERAALIAIGDGKSYLGKRVLEWAKVQPDDPRIPEALFIAFKANGSYKYGCDGWSHDEETQNAAAALLRERYPNSSWTAKLPAPGDQ